MGGFGAYCSQLNNKSRLPCTSMNYLDKGTNQQGQPSKPHLWVRCCATGPLQRAAPTPTPALAPASAAAARVEAVIVGPLGRHAAPPPPPVRSSPARSQDEGETKSKRVFLAQAFRRSGFAGI